MNLTELGHRIKTERIKNGLTQIQLSEKTGVGISHLGHIERGQKSCSIDSLEKIAIVLSVSLDYLIIGNSQFGKKDALHKIDKLIQDCTDEQVEKIISLVKIAIQLTKE